MDEMVKTSNSAYADYQAYLLRLWQETPRSPWRFGLQDAASGERYHFPDLESLQAFLTERVDGSHGDEPMCQGTQRF